MTLDSHSLSLGPRLVREVLEPLKQRFVDKDEIIDLFGVCLVGGVNLFLFGPPGTAKSALVQELGRGIRGETFDYLLTRFTEPSELFGPFDIRRLRDGELVTNTEGMLPEASLVFLDELLNANSAILNTLLGVLNERVLRRGREKLHLPLLMAVGASNHLPEDEALGALFDRFLLRVRCDNVAQDRLGEVLTAGWALEKSAALEESGLSVEDLKLVGSCVAQVDLSAVQPQLLELVANLRRAGLPVSDRRAVKMQRVVAASALLCGRDQAETSDLWVFRYIWETEAQVEVIAALVNTALKDIDKTRAHPRSHGDGPPDPEALGRDLEGLAAQVADGGAESLARAADHLSVLQARCQWVQESVAREHLNGRVVELWNAIRGAQGT